jgi:hypothetical protein
MESAGAAPPVADPVVELVRAGGVDIDDDVLVVQFDWNEDGKDDLLVSTGRSASIGERMGADWNVWLSNSAGTYDLAANDMQLLPGILSVVRLPESANTKAVVVYRHLGGGLTGVEAYYLASGKVSMKGLGEIRNDEERAEDVALVKRTFGAAEEIETRRIPATKLLPASAPAR